MQSPLEIVKEMSLNSGVAPYFFDKPCALMIGGKFLASPVLSLPC
jgi:hypothetical protein